MCATQKTSPLLNVFKSTFKALLPFIIALEVVQRNIAIISSRVCYQLPEETAINDGCVQSLTAGEGPALIYISISRKSSSEIIKISLV